MYSNKQINNNLDSKENKKTNLPTILAWIGFFIFLTSFSFTIYDFVIYARDDASKIWFGIFDRFTNQSNWLLFVFIFFYLFFPNHSFLKSNGTLISIMVYIFFTFIGYNAILIPIAGYGYVGSGMPLAGNIWLHILCPIYFLFFGFVHMFFNKNKQPKSFFKTMLFGMIYPTIYMIYIVTIPFVYTSYEQGLKTYSVYGSATNLKDNTMIAAICISAMYLIFFPLSFAMFYYVWKGMNRINTK